MENAKKRRITAEDLYRMKMITSSEISPDGEYILYGLQRVDPETEKKLRSREFNKEGKDNFVRFQIPPEDVSSDTGEILGWFSADAVPVKGIIQDVVFFGDLWGELKERKMVPNSRVVQVTDVVKKISYWNAGVMECWNVG